MAYRFADMIALWSPDADRTATLPVPGKRMTLVNAIGESREIQPGNVRIELRAGAPVYLSVE